MGNGDSPSYISTWRFSVNVLLCEHAAFDVHRWFLYWERGDHWPAGGKLVRCSCCMFTIHCHNYKTRDGINVFFGYFLGCASINSAETSPCGSMFRNIVLMQYRLHIFWILSNGKWPWKFGQCVSFEHVRNCVLKGCFFTWHYYYGRHFRLPRQYLFRISLFWQ